MPRHLDGRLELDVAGLPPSVVAEIYGRFDDALAAMLDAFHAPGRLSRSADESTELAVRTAALVNHAIAMGRRAP